jgi:hypothetical protein
MHILYCKISKLFVRKPVWITIWMTRCTYRILGKPVTMMLTGSGRDPVADISLGDV